MREKLIAAILFVVFLALSLLSINHFSTWHDESYSATLIEGSYSDIISRTALDVHPPLYYLVLKGWSGVFGDSVLTLRLFSTACMAMAILIAWRLLRRQFGIRAGLIALAGMSVGPFLIRYSQEMRMYGMGALLAMASTYILWRLWTGDLSNRAANWLLATYILLIGAALYTHYFLGFLLVAHAVFVLSQSQGIRSISKRWWLAFGLPIILFAVWLPTVLDQFKQVKGAFWIGPFKIESLSSSLINFFLFRQQWELSSWAAVFGLAVIISSVAIFWHWYRKVGHTKQATAAKNLILCLLGVPLLLLIIVSLPPLQPAYQDRYISFYAPLLYGSLALAVASWITDKKTLLQRLPVIVLMAAIAGGLYFTATLGNNQGWRPQPHFTANNIASYIRQNQPGSEVISTSLWTFLDAHIVLGKDTPTKLYIPEGIGKYGNGSAVYDRPELLINDLSLASGPYVWIIEESGRPSIQVPANWQAVKQYQLGYARTILYKLQ